MPEPVIRWREKIAELRTRPTSLVLKLNGTLRFTSVLTAEELNRAHDFTTCAIGEQHVLHPEVVKYEPVKITFNMPDLIPSQTALPVDHTLKQYGTDFYWYLLDSDFDNAERILNCIEDRVLQLKQALNT